MHMMMLIPSATRFRRFKFPSNSHSVLKLQSSQTCRNRCIYSTSLPSPLSSRLPPFTIGDNAWGTRNDIFRRALCTTPPLRGHFSRFKPGPESPFDVGKWTTETRIVAAFAIGGLVYYIAHLEQVPETGRWRFMDVSPSFEAKMAKQRYRELLSEYRGQILPQNHKLSQYVRGVVTTILEANDLGQLDEGSNWAVAGVLPGVQQMHKQGGDLTEDVWGLEATAGDGLKDMERVPGSGGREWTVIVVDDINNINAAASFGNIIVFTGLFNVVQDDENLLAAVIGHEIGHVVARHVPERLSMSKVFIGIALLLDALGLSFNLTQIITTLFLELPGSRNQEIEADTIGIKLMAKACYNPEAAIGMHERFNKLIGEQGGIEFLATHPPSHKRIKRLQPLLAEAHAIRATTPSCAGMYEAMQGFKDVIGW